MSSARTRFQSHHSELATRKGMLSGYAVTLHRRSGSGARLMEDVATEAGDEEAEAVARVLYQALFLELMSRWHRHLGLWVRSGFSNNNNNNSKSEFVLLLLLSTCQVAIQEKEICAQDGHPVRRALCD